MLCFITPKLGHIHCTGHFNLEPHCCIRCEQFAEFESNVPALDIVTHSCLLMWAQCGFTVHLSHCFGHPLPFAPLTSTFTWPLVWRWWCLSVFVEPDYSRPWLISHNWVKYRPWCWDTSPYPASCLSTAQQEQSEYRHRFTDTFALKYDIFFIHSFIFFTHLIMSSGLRGSAGAYSN